MRPRLTPLWLACLCGCLGGCSEKTTPPPSPPSALRAPSRIDFGNLAVGQTLQARVPVSNTGSVGFEISAQSVSGPPFSEVSQLGGTLLAPGGSTHAIVAFSPTSPGPASGILSLEGFDTTPMTVALTGVGLALGVSATPTGLDFGPVTVGLAAPTQTVALVNTEAAPAYVTLATGGTASEYSVRDPRGNPVTDTPVELAPNTPYVLSIAFTPDAVAVFNSLFSVTPCLDQTSANCITPLSVSLSGQGVSGQINLTPNPIVWSGVPDGTRESRLVTISNTGSASALVTCLSLQSLGADACSQSNGTFTLGEPSLELPAVLAAGTSFTVPLSYQAVDASADALVVTYRAAGATSTTAAAPIQASPTPSPCLLSLAPPVLEFTAPGSVSTTLTNSGSGACQVTGVALDASSDPAFALASSQAAAFTLSAGDSAAIGVAFAPAGTGGAETRRGRVDFGSNDPAHAAVQLPLLASPEVYAGGGAWPSFRHDGAQSGLSPVDTSRLAGSVAWTVFVSAPPTSPFTNLPTDYMNSPVVGSDGTIYQLGLNGTLYAVNPDGGLQWSTPLAGPVLDPHPGTPTIAADGTVFVAFGDSQRGVLTNSLYHLSRKGAVLATVPAGDGGGGFELPPALTNGGLLVEASGTEVNVFPVATDGTFGAATTAPLNVGAPNQLAPQLAGVVGPDDTTYWCGSDGCDALAPPESGVTEVPGWPLAPIALPMAASALAFDVSFTGNLLILAASSEQQQLVSINPETAQVVWSFPLPAPGGPQQDPNYLGLDAAADASTGNSGPAIGADGTVYLGNFDGLHAVTEAGLEQSGFPFFTNSDVLTAPAIGGDGTIFFGTADGTFYAVRPDGTLRFKISAGGRIAGSPAIGPSGAVYFTADDGYLYAVR